MAELDLDHALSLTRCDDLRFVTVVPDGWQQGRGTYGGLVLGLLARAMELAVSDDSRPLRTLAGDILSPVLPEEAELRVEILRRGSGLTAAAARLWQGDEMRAHASAVFARRRVTDRELVGIIPPNPPSWEQIEPLSGVGPPFSRAFEYRNLGPLPVSGATELVSEGCLRTHRPLAAFGPAQLIAYIDAWWPSALGAEETLRPMATVAFMFQLLADCGALRPTEPLHYRARSLAAHDGYVSELRELWTTDGRLIALNPQSFAYI